MITTPASSSPACLSRRRTISARPANTRSFCKKTLRMRPRNRSGKRYSVSMREAPSQTVMPSFRTSLLSIVIVSAAFLLGGCRHDPEQNQAHPAAAPASSARLVDVAASSGITYRWQLAGSTPRTILQTIGNGCAFLDFNNDGNLDILLVGPKLALYQGDGHEIGRASCRER